MTLWVKPKPLLIDFKLLEWQKCCYSDTFLPVSLNKTCRFASNWVGNGLSQVLNRMERRGGGYHCSYILERLKLNQDMSKFHAHLQIIFGWYYRCLEWQLLTVTLFPLPEGVTVSDWPCIRLEIGKSEKCHCNQMANGSYIPCLYCVTVTSVTESNFSCTVIH